MLVLTRNQKLPVQMRQPLWYDLNIFAHSGGQLRVISQHRNVITHLGMPVQLGPRFRKLSHQCKDFGLRDNL